MSFHRIAEYLVVAGAQVAFELFDDVVVGVRDPLPQLVRHDGDADAGERVAVVAAEPSGRAAHRLLSETLDDQVVRALLRVRYLSVGVARARRVEPERLFAAEMFGQSGGNYVHENFWFSLLPYAPAFITLALLGHWLRKGALHPAQPLEVKAT